MKKVILFIGLLLIAGNCFSQYTGETIEESIKKLLSSGTLSKESVEDVLKGAIKNPELYNDAWGRFVNYLEKEDVSKWSWLNDLNVKFKTFQSINSSATSLGFSYDFNYSYSNFIKKDKKRISNALSLKLKGNVAFNRNVNPNDFLESSLNYSFSMFTGGVVKQNNAAIFTELNNIQAKLTSIRDMKSQEAIDLWKKFGENMQYSDQYYFAINPRLSLESNQDFSKKQFVYGGDLFIGAKGWNNKSTYAALNIFDYPFALVRWMTGFDPKFTPYGSTFPTMQVSLDNVNPQNDPQRQAITGNLDPFTRYKLESSFRTFVTRVKNENVFFNANVRYYRELDASQAIKTAGLDDHFYFVMALQTTTGFYVSYSKGKLPFDAINDEVYAVGFQYKL